MPELKRSTGFTKVPHALLEMDGLSLSQFKVFVFLKAQKEGYKASISEISNRIKVGISTVQRAIDGLEKIGMLKRNSNSGYKNSYWFCDESEYEEIERKIGTDTEIILEDPVQNEQRCQTDTLFKMNNPLVQNEQGTLFKMNNPLVQNEQPPSLYNNKTRDKTNNKTKEKMPKTAKSRSSSFSFDEWHMEVAKLWQEHYERSRPGLAKKVDLNSWANQIRIMTEKYKALNRDSWKDVLDYVKRDKFWCDKADSIPGLRTKGKNGDEKIVNIIRGIPQYQRGVTLKNAMEGTTEMTGPEKALDEWLNGGRS